MLPLLRQGKDLFIVRRKEAVRCRAGDVVMYARTADQYVLHRVIKVRPEDYVMMGDNCITKEYGIQDDNIIGVMTGYVRAGREHKVTELSYRMYSFIIMHTIGIRVFLKRCKMKLAQCGRWIRKG